MHNCHTEYCNVYVAADTGMSTCLSFTLFFAMFDACYKSEFPSLNSKSDILSVSLDIRILRGLQLHFRSLMLLTRALFLL